MNTRESAKRAIIHFLESDSKYLLLTGTHQNEKHLLALSIIFSHSPKPQRVLFRANSIRNIERFLPGLPAYKIGKFIPMESHYLAIDTLNPASWKHALGIDIAIIYPIDSLSANTAADNIEDLHRRNARKIALVSWTDDQDIYWARDLCPVEVVYDAEEEDPEYHQRVLVHTANVHRQQIPRLPKYASYTPEEYLTRMHCDMCGSSRWARLNKPYPGKLTLQGADEGEFKATCLKCGHEATDNHNWYGQ